MWRIRKICGKFWEKRLKKEYSVDSCEDGEEALDFLSVYSYDIVLLDIMLPKLDGMEVLRRMRQRGWIHRCCF